jgi:gamma-glutamyltranspeptidase
MFNHDPLLVQVGGLAVSVPGEVSGFELAHRALRKSRMAGVVLRYDRTQRSRIPSDLET